MGQRHFKPGKSTRQGPEAGGMQPDPERNGGDTAGAAWKEMEQGGGGAGCSGQGCTWSTCEPRGFRAGSDEVWLTLRKIMPKRVEMRSESQSGRMEIQRECPHHPGQRWWQLRRRGCSGGKRRQYSVGEDCGAQGWLMGLWWTRRPCTETRDRRRGQAWGRACVEGVRRKFGAQWVARKRGLLGSGRVFWCHWNLAPASLGVHSG